MKFLLHILGTQELQKTKREKEKQKQTLNQVYFITEENE